MLHTTKIFHLVRLSNRVKIQREEDEKKLAALQEHNDELTAMENSAKRDIAVSFNYYVLFNHFLKVIYIFGMPIDADQHENTNSRTFWWNEV